MRTHLPNAPMHPLALLKPLLPCLRNDQKSRQQKQQSWCDAPPTFPPLLPSCIYLTESKVLRKCDCIILTTQMHVCMQDGHLLLLRCVCVRTTLLFLILLAFIMYELRLATVLQVPCRRPMADQRNLQGPSFPENSQFYQIMMCPKIQKAPTTF